MSKNKKNKNKKAAIAAESETRTIRQVDSKSLIPPEEPSEPTEQDLDFAKAEKEIAEAIKALKAKQSKLKKAKKQATGGIKLAKMRKFAEETTAWATKAAAKYEISVARANLAIGNLADYEDKLDLPEKERKTTALIARMAPLTGGAECLEQCKIETAK